MEKRYSLTQRQYQELVEAQRGLAAAKTAYDAAIRQAASVGGLIADAHGIPEQIKDSVVDHAKKELVVQLPDPENKAQ